MAQNEMNTADREIIISRIINAPQALVYEVWTDPAHIAEWWGPAGFSVTTHEISIQPGGVWRFIMHGPDGTDYQNRIIFEKIQKPQLLSYTHDSDKDNDPGTFHSTVTFEAHGEQTKLTLKSVFASAAIRNMVIEKYHAVEGGNQTIDRFEAQLQKVAAGVKELVIEREYDAPKELVFKAWTEAGRLAEWWGPAGFTIGNIKLDMRPGGRFHYSMSNNGFTMWGLFIYREIAAPEKIVFVSSFSDAEGNIVRGPFLDGKWPLEVLNTLTLTEHNGKTKLLLRGRPINATAEEMKLYEDNTSSMQQGFKGTFDQLEAYLEKAKASTFA